MHLDPAQDLPRPLTWLLSALSLPYKAGAALQMAWRGRSRKRYDDGWIVSIDNLSFGGTGKTSLILALGEWLSERAIPFAVVTRGYRSRLEREGGLVLARHTAAEAGDEALLIAHRLPNASVFVGRDRHRSITAALALGNRVVLLDDGLQTADLVKDRRIMLVDPRHPFYYRRHFARMMRREDGVLFHETVPLPPPANCWGTYRFVVEGLFDACGSAVPPPWPPLVAFSALGDNLRFQRSLAGAPVREFLSFPDHHHFTMSDLERIEKTRLQAGAGMAICTEKDWVKIVPLLPAGAPFLCLRNRLQLPSDAFSKIFPT